MIRLVIAAGTRMPAGISEDIAQEALREALVARCGGGSWRGIARGVAWQLVVDGDRRARSIELVADAAEVMFVSLLDQAAWEIEQSALEGWHEFLEARPGDKQGALAAARLDAGEAAPRALESVCDRLLETLRERGRRAA